jgi:hypothetical protein
MKGEKIMFYTCIVIQVFLKGFKIWWDCYEGLFWPGFKEIFKRDKTILGVIQSGWEFIHEDQKKVAVRKLIWALNIKEWAE